MVTLEPQQIIRAKLRLEVEPADSVIKQLLSTRYDKHANVFVYLKHKCDQFWNTSLLGAVRYVHEWMQLLGVPDDLDSVKKMIWENLLCRLSLDEHLITDRISHGNEVLSIFMEVIETTLYSRLDIREFREPRESRELRESRESRDSRRDVRDVRDVRDLRDSLREFRDGPPQPRELRDVTPMEPTEPITFKNSSSLYSATPGILPPSYTPPPQRPANPMGTPIRIRKYKEEIKYKPKKERLSKKGSRSRKQFGPKNKSDDPETSESSDQQEESEDSDKD